MSSCIHKDKTSAIAVGSGHIVRDLIFQPNVDKDNCRQEQIG